MYLYTKMPPMDYLFFFIEPDNEDVLQVSDVIEDSLSDFFRLTFVSLFISLMQMIKIAFGIIIFTVVSS